MNTGSERLTVALYVRVSSEEQKQGHNIDSQIAELRQFATKSGWPVISAYQDEAWSGAVLDRPALDRLRDDARKSLFDAVLINGVDQLARDVSCDGDQVRIFCVIPLQDSGGVVNTKIGSRSCLLCMPRQFSRLSTPACTPYPLLHDPQRRRREGISIDLEGRFSPRNLGSGSNSDRRRRHGVIFPPRQIAQYRVACGNL